MNTDRKNTYQRIGEWLNSKGYDLDLDDDGLWFEDYVLEHKWKDIFELMLDFHSRQLEEKMPRRNCEECKNNKHHSPASAEDVINGIDDPYEYDYCDVGVWNGGPDDEVPKREYCEFFVKG